MPDRCQVEGGGGWWLSWGSSSGRYSPSRGNSQALTVEPHSFWQCPRASTSVPQSGGSMYSGVWVLRGEGDCR